MDENNPLCERLSFVSIFQSNLDEFLMVRVGSLDAGKDSKVRENKTNMTCQEQLDRIIVKEKKLREKKDEIYLRLMYEMEEYGVKELLYKDLNEDEQDSMKLYFETRSSHLSRHRLSANGSRSHSYVTKKSTLW